MPEPPSTIAMAAMPTFAQRNGYGDPTHPSFGRNDWSKRLGELQFNVDSSRELVKAFSWLSLIIEPTSHRAISINIAEEVTRFPSSTPASDKPYERFPIPREVRTTANSVVLYNQSLITPTFWTSYLRFDERGNIEYACTGSLFAEDQNKGARFFRYVQLIGTIWQFLFWGKNFLASAGYASGIRLLVNLVGTRGTILAQFSHEPGKDDQIWRDPLYDEYGISSGVHESVMCQDLNLQFEYQLVIGNLSEASLHELVTAIARRLGLAYNHRPPPRCFNYNTNIFPWRQYLENLRPV
jgi:hypothetical protein